MIIRPDQDQLIFISQPDHASAAAELVAHFEGFALHPRRGEIALAVREHDHGWADIDEHLVFDPAAGRAFDFITVPDTHKRSVWPIAVERLAARSTYAAALVAEHAIYVYDANRGKPDWEPHFADLEQRRTILLEQSGVPLETLREDYPFLALADLLSLAMCLRWPDARERFGRSVRSEADAVTIAPALLSGPVRVAVKARRVPDQRYSSVAELRDTLDRAPIESLPCLVCNRESA
jgi:hypothetical protein